MKEYVKNMKEYECNMTEYLQNMKEYEGNMMLYEEIWWNMWKIWRNMSIYWIWHSHIYMGFGTWKNSEHRLHIVSETRKDSEFSPLIYMGLGTWKNCKLCLYIGLYRLWDLKKFHAGAFLLGSGIWKNVQLPLPSITAYWRGVILVSPSSKNSSCQLTVVSYRSASVWGGEFPKHEPWAHNT